MNNKRKSLEKNEIGKISEYRKNPKNNNKININNNLNNNKIEKPTRYFKCRKKNVTINNFFFFFCDWGI